MQRLRLATACDLAFKYITYTLSMPLNAIQYHSEVHANRGQRVERDCTAARSSERQFEAIAAATMKFYTPVFDSSFLSYDNHILTFHWH